MSALEPRSRDGIPLKPRVLMRHGPTHAKYDRVLWAVDASSSDIEHFKNSIAALQLLAPQASVLPVYILDPEGLNWAGETSQDRSELLRPAAEAALERIILDVTTSPSGLRNWLRPWIVELRDVPLMGLDRKLARKLLSRAARFGADLILVQHRRRTGLRRWLKACFTELLINEGGRPLLIVGPRSRPLERIDQMIFATNFSPACRKAFETALFIARDLKIPVRLIHKLVPSLDPVVHSGALILGGSWLTLPGITESMLDVYRAEGQAWVDHAETLNVPVEFISDDSADGLAPTFISLCRAAHNAFLVMAAPSFGSLHRSPWGSVTRDVLDEVPCPVLVLRG
ncbi:MAG: universal stress protein [Bdellovibrionaceae bacterium]|nr:universal stress protein [Pseudobdellovibrionaceae bacterium]